MDILFWRHRSKRKGYTNIYCRITVSGDRADLGSVGISALWDEFDPGRNRFKPTSGNGTAYNQLLSNIENELLTIFNTLCQKRQPFTADTIKRLYLAESDEIATLADAFERFIVDSGVKPNTLKSYRGIQAALLEHLGNVRQTKVLVSEFDLPKFLAYRNFLTHKKKYAESTKRKHLSVVKQVCIFAKLHGLSPNNPLEGFKVKMEEVADPIFLTQEQFEKLRAHRFQNPRLQRTADVFIVYCRTGFHYEDLRALARNFEKAVHIDEQGREWIQWRRIKTGIMARVPIFPEVVEIVEKYGGWHKLPFTSNVKMNDYLKLVAMELKFPEPLASQISVKTGRKTFSSYLLNTLGWRRGAVKVILGLRTDRSLDAYAREDERLIRLELEEM
ncbi:phage integrase SAM-like domain-containing protein [Arundinibacter roseus]|uniref:Core-binding (CB) domain-containing protein n=1 Tax=Arundinibacter roseus TaxID=2070510 RepID=A0A4R4KLA1_9BACT|nr:phage integrase SAM-like domain-containing protein [Arundinibacter roseus]TDB69124.1 hypothetical protein EZE20_01955 [Arundinibacter roseus]